MNTASRPRICSGLATEATGRVRSADVADQAAMRHRKLDLTMSVYTDPGLLDTATAIESLPHLPAVSNQTVSVAPMVAPNLDNEGGLEGIPEDQSSLSGPTESNKKARKTLGFTGFSEVEDNGLEPMTSTMPL